MIVAGIDPSLTGTGIGIINNGTIIDHASIGFPGRDGASDIDRTRRVVAIVIDVRKFISQYEPDVVTIESPAYGQYLPSTCDRNFLWGALVHEYGVAQKRAYASISPTCRAQFATGKGHAPKQAVIDTVNAWWPHLNLKSKQDNEADGIVLAAMGAARYQPDRIPFALTDWRRNNLNAVHWPVMP